MAFKIKRVLVVVMMAMMVTMLTGCDIPADVANSLQQSFSDRAEANKNIANRLYGSGLIRQDTYDKLIKEIDGKLGNITANMGADNKATINMLKACVAWRIPIESDHQIIKSYDKNKNPIYKWKHSDEDVIGGSPCAGVLCASSCNICADGDSSHKEMCDTHKSAFITTYLVGLETGALFWTNQVGKEAAQENAPACMGEGAVIKPIEVISESMVKELNEQLSIPIYVLKTTADSNEGTGLDGIMEAVKRADNTNSEKEAESILANYFEAATYKDKNGKENALTIMDPNIPEQQIVRVTSKSYEEAENSNWDPYTFNGEQVEVCHYNGYANFPSDEYGNAPGIDATIYMAGEKVLAVRMVEFNKKAVDELDRRIGLGENRYLVLNGRAYLMEYPIGYIEGFIETEDRLGYNSIIKQSQLGFNLLTGEFSKFSTNEDGSITNQSVAISKDDPYLTYMGASSASEESMASLIMYGETGVSTTYGGEAQEDRDMACNPPWDLKFGGTDSNPYVVSTGRIVLRDYLEATYAPGIVSGDSVIVLGRKLRILQLDGDKSNPVAKFYGKDGAPLDGSDINIFIDDFASISPLTYGTPYVEYISSKKEKLDITAEITLANGNTWSPSSSEASDDSGDADVDVNDSSDSSDENNNTGSGNSTSDSGSSGLKENLSEISGLNHRITSVIYPTTRFPGPSIGFSDYSETDNKQLFYAMLVKKDMFETGLFSGWVQSTDQNQNSVLWWNNWLSDHGYLYNINPDNLVDYLTGNFKYELNKSGVIILDLETIAKIQEEFDQQDKVETSRGLRTVFIILGYILIAYSFILLIAWNVDVNVDLGFNLLEKLSLGRWVAVKDYEEMPFINQDEVSFINFWEILVKCIIIAALGIVLILVNAVDLMIMLVSLFGGVAEYLTDLFLGVR